MRCHERGGDMNDRLLLEAHHFSPQLAHNFRIRAFYVNQFILLTYF